MTPQATLATIIAIGCIVGLVVIYRQHAPAERANPGQLRLAGEVALAIALGVGLLLMLGIEVTTMTKAQDKPPRAAS